MSAPFRIIASGPSVGAVFAKVRDIIQAQRECGAISEAEAAGASWATDKIEALQREESSSLFSDDIHDLTVGAVRGG